MGSVLAADCSCFRPLLILALLFRLGAEVVAAQHGVVATVHPLASEAAAAAGKAGGNAVDAAVAAALTLGVVDGHNSGIGGGCFMVIRLADGRVVAIDGREKAPAAATRDMYLRNGKADPQLSQMGALAIAVPGAIAAYDEAVSKYGKLPLRRHLEAAAQIAENGFPITPTGARRIASTQKYLAQFPASRAVFLNRDGQPPEPGTVFQQPDLAKTYRAIASQGTDWFYRGGFAQATAAWMQGNGGLITAKDFADYRVKLREPVRTTYRGYEIIGMSPPSSGGVHVAQILNILEHFDLKAMGRNSADMIHVVTEAMKLAFADRAWWLGDPDFAPVPRGLVARDYAMRLAKRIRLDRATPVPSHGVPPRAEADLFSRHTTHFSTGDSDGNWVACTATINTTFGSKVVIPGTGVVMNNQMDDFSAQPGTTNFFGLMGNEANAVAPGKRPLSSMSPTLVLKDGKPVFSVGAAGGPTIISQTVLALIHFIDFGLPPAEVLQQPRFHHQWLPDELKIERSAGKAVLDNLERRGHKLAPVNAFGAAQAVARLPGPATLVGVADPRGEGTGLSW